jgi:hypothetical protein
VARWSSTDLPWEGNVGERDAGQLALDRLTAMEVPVRYARAVDQRDWDGVRACFLPNARVHGTRFQGPLDEYLPVLTAGVEPWATTMHFMGNQLVDLDGDRAHVITYCIAHHHWHEQPAEPHLVVGVVYRDDLVRTPDGWRIGHRAVEGTFTRIGEQVLPIGIVRPK